MERHTDGCIAVSGLAENQVVQCYTTADSGQYLHAKKNFLSDADSSYISENELLRINKLKIPIFKRTELDGSNPQKHHSHNTCHASILAASALKLMSLTTDIHIPTEEHRQLQLRIAINSGPCDAGVINLQTTAGTSRVPHYRLFGQTIHDTAMLCLSGLALQIRVSKQCHNLLIDAGYRFERCPDFILKGKCVESYWLVGAENFDYTLPSLDLAIPLSNYNTLV